MTRGFLKGGTNSKISMYIRHLKESASEIMHPMLLPMIILVGKIGGRSEKGHREARFLIRDIESRLEASGHNFTTQVYGRSASDLNKINIDLMKCHSRIWKHPKAYIDLIDDFQEALNGFMSRVLTCNAVRSEINVMIQEIHIRMLSRLSLSRQRMRGMEAFSQTTLSRINMQRTSLHNILLNLQTHTALQIEERQQLEAHEKFRANQNWSRSQMSLSLLGTVFLPGAFIAVSITALNLP